jgi:hypothetical protein
MAAHGVLVSGWPTRLVDQALRPVLKALANDNPQSRLEQYFRADDKFAKIESKRMQAAVKGLAVQVCMLACCEGA